MLTDLCPDDLCDANELILELQKLFEKRDSSVLVIAHALGRTITREMLQAEDSLGGAMVYREFIAGMEEEFEYQDIKDSLP